jgi:hypothetical protein
MFRYGSGKDSVEEKVLGKSNEQASPQMILYGEQRESQINNT